MKCESILHRVYAAIKSPRRGLARNLIMSPSKYFLTEWLLLQVDIFDFTIKTLEHRLF